MILNTAEAGEGRPVVLLHGLFGQGRNFGALSRRLATRCRVIVVDMPNHGPSLHPPRMDVRSMAVDVAETLAARGDSGADVMGHSMGGKTAMMLALTAPVLVGRLVVSDIAPVAYPPRYGALLEAMRTVPAGASRAAAEAALADAEPDPATRAFILSNRRPDGSGWRIGIGGIAASMEAILDWAPPAGARFEGPALFVSGERSGYVREENRPAIRDLFPAARFLTVKGAGHWVHADQPEAFAAVLEGFFRI